MSRALDGTPSDQHGCHDLRRTHPIGERLSAASELRKFAVDAPRYLAVPGLSTRSASGRLLPQHEVCGWLNTAVDVAIRGHLIQKVTTLSHSHLAIRHLIRQIDEYAARRQGGRAIPDWLTGFVQHAAELFEPFSGVARPGFECAYGEDRWEISIFLGKTERVGGRDDGAQSPVNFKFDVQGLIGLFDNVQSVRWNAFPDVGPCGEDLIDLSFLVAEGIVRGEAVALQVLAGPPENAGPALRQYDDGSYATV